MGATSWGNGNNWIFGTFRTGSMPVGDDVVFTNGIVDGVACVWSWADDEPEGNEQSRGEEEKDAGNGQEWIVDVAPKLVGLLVETPYVIPPAAWSYL